ncbi:5-oxoprolinase/urea amidolyase family protein [Microbacterium sp. Marseille-Q6965]|uniref:5-oxoprolinase subunit B/C family protein n=1 Tax=Microbacterium sp. Marseille-Q6965 TaxID=2965072 RepID=UPI0021B79B67|nr:5-oxoprolinase/urea amidolyase family protein [Microbacterium sp. Marseille-Q6965]
MRFLRAGVDGVLVEVEDLDRAIALLRALEADPVPGVHELIPAARTVYARFSPFATTPPEVTAAIRSRQAAAVMVAEGRLVSLPVVYDGEDLAQVASLTGLGVDEVVARHVSATYTVAFAGFAPGFAYLAGLDPRLHVPRRDVPRTAIPAGSVAVAGEFTGVYPRSSPGGWQLLGRALESMWDLRRDPPALLQPGMRVRFEARRETLAAPGLGVTHDRVSSPSAPDAGAAGGAVVPAATVGASGSRTGAGVEIVEAGPQSLVQDLGRPGHAALGVSASGAMDRAALRRANRLVGNPVGAAGVEVAVGGLVLRARGELVAAVTGALVPLAIRSRSGVPRVAPCEAAFALADGDELELGVATAGVYAYVAVRGGLGVAGVLGSASRDVLAALGPDPLRPGEVLPVGRASASAVLADAVPPAPPPASGEEIVVALAAGPRDDWFTEAARAALFAQPWEVTPQSNRVGLRLAGSPLERAIPGELPSEATPAGALQVPASGQPVLFTADHPLTGGYPVAGVVPERDLDRAAQVPPGGRIRFRRVP